MPPPIVPTITPDFRTLTQNLDPEQFRSILYSHPLSQRIRWFQAMPDPTAYDQVTGKTDTTSGKMKWLRTENLQVGQFRAIIQNAQPIRRRFAFQGDLHSDDIVLTTMPDELPVGDHDWIIPIGQSDYGTPSIDSRLLESKEIVVRGGIQTPMSGTISSSGVNVTGVGTTFTSEVQAGDLFQSLGQTLQVKTVSSNTSLILQDAPTTALSGIAWTKLSDQVIQHPVAQITLLYDGTTYYQPFKDFEIAADQQTIYWLGTNQPAPSARYSIVYRYWPKYVVMGDLGVRRHVVHGTPIWQTIVCRLSPYDTHTR